MMDKLIPYTIQLVGAYLGVFTAAMIFDAPKKQRHICGLIGFVSWIIYLFFHEHGQEGLAIYTAALFIAMCSQVMARKLKMPVTVTLLPSMFCLVPGISLFRAVYYLLRDNGHLFAYNMRLTLMTAGMIALSIFTADFLTRSYYNMKKERQAKREAIAKADNEK